MPEYYSQTGSHVVIAENPSTAKDEEVVQNYKFVKTPVIFKDQAVCPEEIISPEDEKNFYRKAFETKSF
jgi:hypothetical protein